MKRLTLTAFLLLPLLAACGGDDDEGPTPTFTVAGGVNTSLPRHLVSVAPEQESTVTNEDLDVGEEFPNRGICAAFDFTVGETMGDDPLSRVTLVVGGEDVTDSALWQIATDQPLDRAAICYVPPQPLEPGEQVVTVRYSDATDRQFIYNWSFTIAEAAAQTSPSP